MKRDMDLVRSILFRFEETDAARIGLKSIEVPGYTSEQIRFHVELMEEAELLENATLRPQFGDGRSSMIAIGLGYRPTMKGYDFLDSVRDPKIWKKTKDAVSNVGGASLDLMLSIAKDYGKKIIEQSLGLG